MTHPLHAAPVFPLDTDQSACYDSAGDIIPCRHSGQDGQFAAPPPFARRFRIQGEGVVDRLTGFIWLKNAGAAEFPLTWEEASAFIARMNRERAGGGNGWQLPGRRELFSLVSHARINPALPEGHPFDNVFSGYYWTATPCARLPGQSFCIHMGGARLTKELTSRSAMVWPVRVPGISPAAEALPRFRDLDTVTAQDRRTGLVWLKTADLCAGPLTWREALKAVHDLNARRFLGHADWRLPNIREIESLIDTGRHSPALPHGHPFTAVKDGYWSATSSAYEPRYAWVLNMVDGLVGVGFKAHPEFYVWPVRRPSPSASGERDFFSRHP